MCIDIKDFFLQSISPEYKYMIIHQRYFYLDIRQKYNIDTLVNEDGYVYCRLKKGMYALKQAARLAHDELVSVLEQYGYQPDRIYPNFWAQNSACALMILVLSIILMMMPTT